MKTKSDLFIDTWQAQMLLGEESLYAGQARFVISGRTPVNGVERSLFGGILLGHHASPKWEAFDGCVIVIPHRQLELLKNSEGKRIDQLLVELNHLSPAKRAGH